MNKEISDILQSDLLERYVLGDVTDQERAKVLSLRQSSPKIKKVLDELEKSMEMAAIDHKVNVSSALKEKIINKNYKNDKSMPRSRYLISWLPYAACLVLGIALTWFVQNQEISKLKEANLAFKEQVATLEANCRKVNEQIAFINDNNTSQAVLKGTAFAPTSEVVIFWNEVEKECLLRVSNLPDIPSDKTYQLWADVDGKMLSLGTFDHQSAKLQLIQMAYLDNAESLNITVEKNGGSEHPDVSTLSAVTTI